MVYAKKPIGGPAQVLAYLGRYTHRVAIANSRIKAWGDDCVAFTRKDYRQNGAEKVMCLKPNEFIRRFLLHTLPDGFHRTVTRLHDQLSSHHQDRGVSRFVNEGPVPENAASS